MHKPNESFDGPMVRTVDELNSWMDAYVESTQNAAREKRHTPSQHAAADMLSMLHIDFRIVASAECALKLRWKYNIRIRRVVPSFLPKPREYTKKHSFRTDEIADMIGRMPKEIREIGADSLVMTYMEDFRARCAREVLSAEVADAFDSDDSDVGNDEVLEAIDTAYPGELERLYAQIRTGTLGK